MKKFILRRALQHFETEEIEAENWEEATAKFNVFIDEPIPDDCVVITERSHIEYIGEA